MTDEIKHRPRTNPQDSMNKLSSLKGMEFKLQKIDEKDHLESELHLTLEEIARLQNALAESNMKLIAYQSQRVHSLTSENEKIQVFSELLKEIYQPLATITNYCELLQNQNVGALGPLQSKFLNRISSSVEQIRQLLDQFENTSSPEVKEKNINSNSLWLSEILNKVIKDKSDCILEKQITIQLMVAENMPEITGTEEEILKIVETVFDNALTITPIDHIVKISTHCVEIRKDRYIQLVVKDGGPGIKLDDLQKIFSVHAIASEPHISGVSLTRAQIISLQNLIQDQNGTLSIRNGMDYGAIFEIRFSVSSNLQ